MALSNQCVYPFDASIPSPYTKDYLAFILEFHTFDVLGMLAEPNDTRHFSLPIDFCILLDSNCELAHLTLAFPEHLFPLFDEALLQSQQQIYAASAEKSKLRVKPLCHARLFNLHLGSETTKPNISSIRSTDVGRYISLSGTLIRTGVVKMLEAEREYECTKCKHHFRVYSTIENGNTISLPKTCNSSENGKKCKGTVFTYIEGSRVCRDYQEIKIQEQVQKLTMGVIPRSILAVLQDDLVDSCLAGDDIVVCGLVRHLWKPVSEKEGSCCDLELMIDCFHVRSNQESKKSGGVVVLPEHRAEFEQFWKERSQTPLRARDLLVQSVCPQLYGLYMVKLAVLMTLIGGVAHTDPSGTRTRGESHLLLIGDPGTGKSQMLRYAAKLSSRAVTTTGIGTTSAGLTVSVVKETGGDWALEAGAMVLADGGLCCIDEFDSIRESDRATIHECMEQQTLSVAKAGLVATLNTRATVFAALNPKGSFDQVNDLSVNTAIAGPLLSRFDLILLLMDKQDEEWDKRVTQHILDSLDCFDAVDVPSAVDLALTQIGSNQLSAKRAETAWMSLDKMQAYCSLVKRSFKPVMTKFSEQILTKYYGLQRRADTRNAARTTIRLLESIVRLAQAHARLMFRTVVLPQDAIAAVYLVECSLQTSSLLGLPSIMHATYPEDPDASYLEQEQYVLQKLDLPMVPDDEREFDYSSLCYDFESGEYRSGAPALEARSDDAAPQMVPAFRPTSHVPSSNASVDPIAEPVAPQRSTSSAVRQSTSPIVSSSQSCLLSLSPDRAAEPAAINHSQPSQVPPVNAPPAPFVPPSIFSRPLFNSRSTELPPASSTTSTTSTTPSVVVPAVSTSTPSAPVSATAVPAPGLGLLGKRPLFGGGLGSLAAALLEKRPKPNQEAPDTTDL